MATFTINGHDVRDLRVTVPGRGCWYATITTDLEVDLTPGDAAQVTIFESQLAGTITSGSRLPEGYARYNVIGGAGGWGRELPPRPYANDALAKDQVIKDAATEASETVEAPPTDGLGPHYVRQRARGSALLNALAGKDWYVGYDGVTRFGAHTVGKSVAELGLDVIQSDPARGVTTVALRESFEGVAPGMTTELGPVVDVEVRIEGGLIVAQLYSSAVAKNRQTEALAKIVDSLDPDRKFRGTYEFRVVEQSGELLALQPTLARADFPDLERVPIRCGIPGARFVVKPGALVLVTFINADPSRPCVTAFDPVGSETHIPVETYLNGELLQLEATAGDLGAKTSGDMTLTSTNHTTVADAIKLGASAALGVARLNDAILAGPYAGTITAASTTVTAQD